MPTHHGDPIVRAPSARALMAELRAAARPVALVGDPRQLRAAGRRPVAVSRTMLTPGERRDLYRLVDEWHREHDAPARMSTKEIATVGGIVVLSLGIGLLFGRWLIRRKRAQEAAPTIGALELLGAEAA